MSDIAVMTDSNCGLMPEEGRRYGICILPMPVLIDGNTYYEGVDITSEMFYEKQKAGALITSSQPSPGDVIGMWDRLLKEHDEVVYIPMSSGLSQSCASSMSFAREEKYKDRVFVVDNHRISVTLTHAVLDALNLAKQGRCEDQRDSRAGSHGFHHLYCCGYAGISQERRKGDRGRRGYRNGS